MTGYHLFLLGILVIAGIVNIYQSRVLALVFVSAVFLLFLGNLLPPPNVLQAVWFKVLIETEFLFACCALLSFSTAGRVIAGFCAWNIIGHILGWVSYQNDLSIYSLYTPIIQAGEIAQTLALILFSPRIINLAVWFRTKDRSHDDGWHRLEHYI